MSAAVKPVELFLNPDLDPIPGGIRLENLVHCFRILGINPETGELGQSLDEQLDLAYSNMQRLVQQAGGSRDNIAQVTFFLKDLAKARAVNRPWVEMFPNEQDRPTYKCMPAPRLPGDQLLHVEAFALLGARRKVLNILPVAHNNPIPMGVRIGNMVFSSRILPHDPATGKHVEDVETQADFVVQNLHRLLREAKTETAAITQGRAFLSDLSYLPLIESRWATLFPNKPARPILHSVVYNSVPHLRVMLEIVAVETAL